MNLLDFRALTFDCYGTLIDWERGILDALRPWVRRHRLGVGDEELLAAYGEFESREQAAAPAMPYPQILRAVFGDIAKRWGADVTAQELAAFGQSVRGWPAFADSPAALRYLKNHYTLVIVSNVDRGSFAHSNEKLGVQFDAVITAEDVQSYKPALRHFEFALERLAGMRIYRADVLHVAQSLYHDHVPAQALGLRTVWVDRRAGKTGAGAARPAGVEIHPDLVVSDLASLVAAHRAARGQT